MTTQSDFGIFVQDIRQSVDEIVRTVLDREDIDSEVDIFDQGATSLAFIRIVARLNEKYDIAIDVSTLEEASIDSLSALIGAQASSSRRTE
jgi:acyl carrier protein